MKLCGLTSWSLKFVQSIFHRCQCKSNNPMSCSENCACVSDSCAHGCKFKKSGRALELAVADPDFQAELRAMPANNSSDSCPICLDVLGSRILCFLTSCGHQFHMSCILRCMRHSVRCPSCRTEVSPRADSKVDTLIYNWIHELQSRAMSLENDVKSLIGQTRSTVSALTKDIQRSHASGSHLGIWLLALNHVKSKYKDDVNAMFARMNSFSDAVQYASEIAASNQLALDPGDLFFGPDKTVVEFQTWRAALERLGLDINTLGLQNRWTLHEA